ncbi:MAG TPA: hypothetical protein VMS31_06395 [Pyrinomonadaceae bacterium]|nr:hypothetical protein [Pyrinomonadaceae bacterium]
MRKMERSGQGAVGSGQQETGSVRPRLQFHLPSAINCRLFRPSAVRSLLLSSGVCRLLLPNAVCRVLALFLLLTAHWSLLTASARAQEVVDKMVATVNAGMIPECADVCLITYSDLRWQLALEPNTPLDNPSSADLNHALSLLIDQRLILQEAEKLPTIAPTPREIEDAGNEFVKEFLQRASLSLPEFQQRLRKVGLTGDRFNLIMTQRLKIEKYLDFRFRNFVVITQQEIADYYRDVYVPRLKARGTGQILPTLEQARPEIEMFLKEAKIESDTDSFLDSARERAEIVTLSSV